MIAGCRMGDHTSCAGDGATRCSCECHYPEEGDREPQPEDGPDYHAEHAAWRNRR